MSVSNGSGQNLVLFLVPSLITVSVSPDHNIRNNKLQPLMSVEFIILKIASNCGFSNILQLDMKHNIIFFNNSNPSTVMCLEQKLAKSQSRPGLETKTIIVLLTNDRGVYYFEK